MKHLLILVMASTASANEIDKLYDEKVTPKQVEYSVCMDNAGRDLAKSKSTAAEIADAAQSKCEIKYEEFEAAIKKALAEAKVYEGADKIAEKQRKRWKSRVIEIVVEKRK